jgi:hypothetical protein
MFIHLLPFALHAQGCSDAGFCTVSNSSPEPHVADSAFANCVKVSGSIAQGEQKTTVCMIQLEYLHVFKNHSIAELKIPYYVALGNLGNYGGISDPILTYTQVFALGKFTLNSAIGTRIGTGRADNTTREGVPLPMAYQRSLATTDLILSVSTGWGKYFSFGAGFQQPVVQYNNNGYLAYSGIMGSRHYNEYFSSKSLKRKGDILLRADLNVAMKRLRLSVGTLAIYHLGKDKARGQNGEVYAINYSEGLTLNLTAHAGYSAGQFAFHALVAGPVIVRSNRPDGLTRSWILSCGTAYRL